MSNNKQTRITIETHSVTIIRTGQNQRSNFVYCRQCQRKVASFRAQNAALIFGVHLSELEHLYQLNSIHTANNDALCGNSLAEFFDRKIHFIED